MTLFNSTCPAYEATPKTPPLFQNGNVVFQGECLLAVKYNDVLTFHLPRLAHHVGLPVFSALRYSGTDPPSSGGMDCFWNVHHCGVHRILVVDQQTSSLLHESMVIDCLPLSPIADPPSMSRNDNSAVGSITLSVMQLSDSHLCIDIVRLLFMVPIYAIVTLASYIFYVSCGRGSLFPFTQMPHF